ncbi:centrosomal protein 15 kDa-like [Ylistrum balloti]|uniref:centrosomal protein 15 kDa-like n=1 Tax=Ylistrum balloti TaxID=509963 RepID=UPI002905B241|nr:centrosomal protein 15 kDa-like [Ylistrum balloti]
MKRPTDPRYDAVETYDDKLANWTRTELQLSRLHEEILTQREALMNYSLSYTRSQDSRILQETAERERARLRNEQFLQNIADTGELLEAEAAIPPSPRLTTLQNNYWAMVRSMVPLYEKSLEHHNRGSHSHRSSSAMVQKQSTSSHKGRSSKSSKKKTKKA